MNTKKKVSQSRKIVIKERKNVEKKYKEAIGKIIREVVIRLKKGLTKSWNRETMELWSAK
jgi:hypothetical protein